MPIVRLILVMCLLLPVSAVAQSGLERGYHATFRVFTADRGRVFLGSAFLWGVGVDVSRHVVTNAHVVKDRRSVMLQDSDGLYLSGDVIRVDARRDLALIRLDNLRAGALRPAEGKAGFGDPVMAFGAPLGLDIGLSRGHVSLPFVMLEPQTPVGFIRHDAAVNPGSSGGPLLDAQGHVLGMNSQIADGSRLFAGVAYAIPVDVISRFVAGQLRAVPDLGMRVRPVTPLIAEALGVEARGVLVDQVMAQGVAARAGGDGGRYPCGRARQTALGCRGAEQGH